ncbi:MAG: exo-alpha-sialidase, partial [Thermoguttaceae bacterium]|nr:exo-alpha-sialidase [Thermoguttaceae bacterium]
MQSGGAHVPVWSLSGGTIGQSVAATIPSLPSNCSGVKIEIIITTESETDADSTAVYRVHLAQPQPDRAIESSRVIGPPVAAPLPDAPLQTRRILLESFYPVDPAAPLAIRIQREPGDPRDFFERPVGLIAVVATPLHSPPTGTVVQDVVENGMGYNSWPMIQAIGPKLVCVYSRGSAHTIDEDARRGFARTSSDGGQMWGPETLFADAPNFGEVAIGKGADSTGAALFWMRRVGPTGIEHDLYRTVDGAKFEKISTPTLNPMPMQITDVFAVPRVGLMCLWFAGDYSAAATQSWGTLVSADDGATWTQNVVESGLTKADWPKEKSAVSLGAGKIFALARTEIC